MSRSASCVCIIGCVLSLACRGDLALLPAENLLNIVGIDDEGVFYLYRAHTLGLESPASLWQLDLETGESRRIHEATRDHAWAAFGDYYIVLEFVEDGRLWYERVSKLSGVQISTGQQFTIAERMIGFPLLDASRVLSLTSDGLQFFDLPGRAIVRTISVPEATDQLVAFKDNQAVAMRIENPASCPADGTVIHLDEGEHVEIPPAPGFLQPNYLSVGFSDTRLVTSQIRPVLVLGGEFDVLEFDIPTRTWRILAVYEAYDALLQWGTYAEADACGVNETHALVDYYRLWLDDLWRFELIDLQTGERTVIAEQPSQLRYSDLTRPFMHGSRVYWIDQQTQALIVYDIPSSSRRTFALDFPPRE